MCQWMMKVCLPWTHQDIRTIQKNTIHFQKGTRSTLTRGQIYCQALEILGNRFEIMSENKTKKETNLKKNAAWKRKKVKSTLWIVLTSNFKISEKKNKHLSRKISKGCLPKKILEHTTILSLIAQCGAYPFTFNFFLKFLKRFWLLFLKITIF